MLREAASAAPLAGSGRASQEKPITISACDQLNGKITEVKKGAKAGHVRLNVGGTVMIASFANEAVDDLGPAVGRDAYSNVRATDVMIAIDKQEQSDGALE